MRHRFAESNRIESRKTTVKTRNSIRSFLPFAGLTFALVFGCDSPEMGRARGGGHGGDGGNTPSGGVRPPSKLDGTKTWTARPKT